MGAEYGSGRAKPIFTSASVSISSSGGTFPAPLNRTFRLHLVNEAGLSLASDPVSVSIPAGGRATVSFPEANRDVASGYKYCFVSAAQDANIENAWAVGCWRMFQIGSETFATAVSLIFSRPEHLVVPPAIVANPTLLPSGTDLIPGMVRLVSGGVNSGASYYIHAPWLVTNPNSPFFQHEIDGDRAIERGAGEYWVRFGNPQFGLFPLEGDLFGVGGAWRPMVAVDPDAIANSLLFGNNYAASDSASEETMIAPAPLIVHFSSDTGDDIPACRFGLHARIDGINATTLMDRRIAVKFLGFYDPVSGTLDTSSGLNDGASMAGIGEILYQDSGSSGFLATSKTLPGSQKAVFKIYPKFRASEIYPSLVNGTAIEILPVMLPSGGVRVPIASLFENSQGGFVAPGGEFGRVLPGDGTITVLPGRFVIRGFESAMQLKQTVVEVMPNTLNQQITVTKDGKATVRGTVGTQTIPSTEALLAIVDFGTGESKVSNWSNPIALSANGGLNITATYPVSGTFGRIRNDINEIGGNLNAHFNPPQVRIYVLLGSVIYRLNDLRPVTIAVSQAFSITSLAAATVVGSLPNPPFPDFCLFDPPTVAIGATTGSLTTGTYQVAIAYAYTTGTQCTRIRQTVADGCIPAYRESLFESGASGFLDALKNLTTVGLVERTTGGGAITNAISNFGKTLLNLLDAAAARLALGLGNSATRNVGTTTNTVAAGDDSRLTNARTPTSHASTHQAGGADEIPIFGFLAASANITLNATHERQLVEVNATSASITITLPAASTVGAGFQVMVGKSDASANIVTISRAGSDTINGATTITLTVRFQRVVLMSFGGTSWGVVAAFDDWVRTAGNKSISGDTTFTGSLILPSVEGSAVGSLWRDTDRLEYRDSTNTTRVLLNNADNLNNLSDFQTARNNLIGVTANRILRGNGANAILDFVYLNSDVSGILPIANGGSGSSTQTWVDLSTAQTNIAGLKTFTTGVRAGGAIGNVRLTPGGAVNAGYLEIFRGDGTTRQGFIGFDNTNLSYTAEAGGVHSFNGGRVDVFGTTVPPTSASRISLFLNSTNAYLALISSTAAANYKAYDVCNESGNFSIRRLADGYVSISGNLLSYNTLNNLTLGDANTKSTTTYGSLSVSGSATGYAGIHFPQSSDGQILMFSTTSRHCGVWSPSAEGGWHWLYNAGNLLIHSSAAATQGSSLGLYKGLNSLPGYPSDRYPTIRTDFSSLYISIGGAYTGHFTSAGYTNISDKTKKRILNDINPLETLYKISKLPITRFHYRDEDPRITHIGTFAQDFWRAFECGGNQEIIDDASPISPNKMLAVTDVAGVCLSGIQGLFIENQNLKDRVLQLETQLRRN